MNVVLVNATLTFLIEILLIHVPNHVSGLIIIGGTTFAITVHAHIFLLKERAYAGES